MANSTKLSWFGWTLVYVALIKRDLFSKKPRTAKQRVAKAKAALSKARHALLRSTSVANVYTAYGLVRGGGNQNVEEIRSNPEFFSDFKAMMKIQLDILSNDQHRSDMMAMGHNLDERESFFRENLAQHLWGKGVGDKLAEAIAGYHISEKPIGEFTPEMVDEVIDLSADQLATVYRIEVSEGL